MTAMNALTLALVANQWHHDHWWVVFPILWLLLFATLLVVFLRRGSRNGTTSAKQILGERFARGEITLDEYRDRLAQLR
jgi:putative membrane protein